MISKFELILTVLVSCVIFSYFAASQTLSTTTKPPTTTVFRRCNQLFNGVYQGFYYNRSTPVSCSTNCYLYKEASRSNYIEYGGSCNDEPCNGGIFISRFNYSYQYSCCETDRCNTFGFANARLSYTCEFNKTVNRIMQSLVYPHRRSLQAATRKCYFCDKCNMTNPGVIVNCTNKFPTTKTACQVISIDLF